MSSFRKISILQRRISNKLFIQYLTIRKHLYSPSPSRKILFSDSKPDWRKDITKGFKNSRHTIAFDSLTSENIKGYDLLVPLTVQDLESKEIQKLLVNNSIPVPSVESVLLCDDKYLFNKALIAGGFEKYIPKMGNTGTFPYILKKKVDQFGVNTHIIHGPPEEEEYSEQIKSSDYFTQEIIGGRYEYATHVVFRDGRIVNSLNIKYTFKGELSIKGKNESLKTICRCPYLEVFAAMLETIGFEGLCCFNYKVRDNIPYIIEINPRFGSSLTPYFSLFV